MGKCLLIFLFCFAVFTAVFNASQTMEIEDRLVQDEGLPKIRSRHYVFHWDRFLDYLNKLPSKARRLLRSDR